MSNFMSDQLIRQFYTRINLVSKVLASWNNIRGKAAIPEPPSNLHKTAKLSQQLQRDDKLERTQITFTP